MHHQTSFNPYESPRGGELISPAKQGVPEAEVVDVPLKELEKRIKSRRISVAIGTLLAVPMILIFPGSELTFIGMGFFMGEFKMQTPTKAFVVEVAAVFALSGVLVLWSLILGVIGVGVFLDRSGLYKIVRPAHWISFLLEVLFCGPWTFSLIARESHRWDTVSVSEAAIRTPEIIVVPLLILFVGATYHTLMSREAMRMGRMCLERDAMIDAGKQRG